MANAETDCRAVLEELYLYLDGEIAAERCDVIQAHLDACTDCLRRFGFERDVKELVRRKCREGAPPPGLAELLRSRIRAALGE